jgi:hypothetical protein
VRADGSLVRASVPLPTQTHLGEVPRRCSDAQMNSTPRVVAPHHAGTRHPLIVTDPIEPPRVLLTDSAVIHGTLEAPCVAGFDAELVQSAGNRGGERLTAVVMADNDDRAWLFRTTGEKGASPVETRPMKCRLDPLTPVPEEVYRARGTTLP